MNDQQYFLTTSLSCQLRAARQELSSFREGEAYVKLRRDYEGIIRGLNQTIKNSGRNGMIFLFHAKFLK